MPLYEYACHSHGAFELFRPVSQCEKSGDCPECGARSPRLISVPSIQTLSPLQRTAHARNEKSRHAPQVCTTGCGHNHGKPLRKAAPKAPNGLQAYTGPRPWVVEHA